MKEVRVKVNTNITVGVYRPGKNAKKFPIDMDFLVPLDFYHQKLLAKGLLVRVDKNETVLKEVQVETLPTPRKSNNLKNKDK